MGIKHYQEKNARAMEKELAQSDIPVKRKIQKTIRKYHISEMLWAKFALQREDDILKIRALDPQNPLCLFHPNLTNSLVGEIKTRTRQSVNNIILIGLIIFDKIVQHVEI